MAIHFNYDSSNADDGPVESPELYGDGADAFASYWMEQIQAGRKFQENYIELANDAWAAYRNQDRSLEDGETAAEGDSDGAQVAASVRFGAHRPVNILSLIHI